MPPKTRGTDLIKINRNIVSGDPTKPSDTYSYSWTRPDGTIVSGTKDANPCKDATPTFDFDTNACVSLPALATVPTTAQAPAVAPAVAPTRTTTVAPTNCCSLPPQTAYLTPACGQNYFTGKPLLRTNLSGPQRNTTCKGVTNNSLITNANALCFDIESKYKRPCVQITSGFEDMSAVETIYSKRAQWFQNRQLLNSA